MPLQIFFGDDEHTAKDGPYNRVLRTRKWLYVSAGLATVVSLGLYDPAAMNELIQVAAVPTWLARNALVAGLAYLIVQYIMLCVQLLVTYDIALNERLAFRREDDLATGRQKLQDARQAVANYRDERPVIDRDELSQAEADIAFARRALALHVSSQSDGPKNALQLGGGKSLDIDQLKKTDLENKLSQAKRVLEMMVDRAAKLDAARLEIDPIKKSLEDSERAAASSLHALQQEDPARRSGYRKLEIAIDALRVLPPVAFALPVLASLGWQAWIGAL